MPHLKSLAALPLSFDWRNISGTSYVTAITNQFVPAWCGSCWAQATVAVLSDRLKIGRIRRGNIGADIQLSPQYLLDCATVPLDRRNVRGEGGAAVGASRPVAHPHLERHVPVRVEAQFYRLRVWWRIDALANHHIMLAIILAG